MGKLVKPKVFFTGATEVDVPGFKAYLEYTNQTEFWSEFEQALAEGIRSGLALCSAYGKMCYKSLVLGKNSNVSRVRAIADNLAGTLASGHGCYDVETEVLTSIGWKTWPEVTKSDLLATLDEDGRLIYAKPVEVKSFDYSGRMYRVESQGVDLMVTPNHNMYVCPTTTREGRKKDQFKLIRADELGTISHAYTKVADGWEPREPIGWTVDFLRFLGFAIGDGNYESGYRVRFRLRRPRKVAWLNRVVADLASQSHGQWSIDFDGVDRYSVKIAESAVDTVSRIYRDGEKCIPQHVLMTAGRDGLQGLLEGLMQSDGHEGSTNDSFDTTSRVLVDQVQQLCLHCGIAANVCYTIPKAERTSSFGDKPLTRLSILARNLRPEVNKYDEAIGKSYWVEDWPGEVFCAQMPESTRRVLYVRRNGKPVWCGNSVFEHCQLNFIVTDCSRVYTHEQVRHRGGPPEGKDNSLDNDLPGDGVAYSQTSGRYCRLDSIDLVWDDCLDPVKDLWTGTLRTIEDTVYLTECRLGLRKPNPSNPSGKPEGLFEARECVTREVLTTEQAEQFRWVPDNTFDFDKRKAITSAIRRIAPNGQANELGMSINLRTLRHVVQVRTARFAEVEIRDIYSQIYALVSERFPLIFCDAKVKQVNGFPEVFGMRLQPYDIVPGDPKALAHWDTDALKAELARRETA